VSQTTNEAGSDVLPEGYEDVPHTLIRLKPRRRAIARNLTVASQIPALTADVQIDLTELLKARAEWNGAAGRAPEERLSVMAFMAKAALSALGEFPQLNATYTERQLIQWETVNLAVAVDAPGGLVVPVIRDAQTLGVQAIGGHVRDLALRARDGKLELTEMQGGTFTLSNPGAVGPSLRAEALLNPPQVALLGFPGLRRIPIVVGSGENESVEIRTVLCPSLTFDHRALDGGEVIRYLTALASRAESWKLDDYLAEQPAGQGQDSAS